MKSMMFYLTILLTATVARAEVVHQNIQSAEVIVFDAACEPASATEGTLMVNLRARSAGNSEESGKFYSYNEAHLGTDQWSQIPIELCQQSAAKLVGLAGRSLSANGERAIESHEESEDIIGECRGSPMTGDTFPCVKGTKKVTKYHVETLLHLEGLTLFQSDDQ